MSSTPLPATTSRDRTLEPTPVGVDVGVKNLIAAAPGNGDVEAALAIEGSHIRKRHEVLVKAMQTLQGAKFDTTNGQTQLFAALWNQIRPQVYDAAVCVVR
ncbi:transposase [Halopiger djelfimassiliensis]|uniref:transposase n=1 Tax=Halopiger djelfimassiliensis TaxID=1293047 RepID=UPI001E4F6491|nr:transposase [Halopiger djelfimassiliensis]